MSYGAGLLDRRVTIVNPGDAAPSAYGKGGDGVEWRDAATVWAAVTWTRGVRAMREGALDCYDVVMVRMRYRDDVTRRSRLRIGGRLYAIESLHADRRDNAVQMTAVEVTG